MFEQNCMPVCETPESQGWKWTGDFDDLNREKCCANLESRHEFHIWSSLKIRYGEKKCPWSFVKQQRLPVRDQATFGCERRCQNIIPQRYLKWHRLQLIHWVSPKNIVERVYHASFTSLLLNPTTSACFFANGCLVLLSDILRHVWIYQGLRSDHILVGGVRWTARHCRPHQSLIT